MIIFVGGIHGVGKTFISAPVAAQLRIRHATASQLIREERGLQSWDADRRVSAIDENQTALISAITRLQTSGQTLLLDGHFVLRDTVGTLNEIALQVFKDLQIGAVVLLEAGIDVVIERLRKRGDVSWTLPDLRLLAEREITQARRVSTALGIPYKSLFEPSEMQFQNAIRELLIH